MRAKLVLGLVLMTLLSVPNANAESGTQDSALSQLIDVEGDEMIFQVYESDTTIRVSSDNLRLSKDPDVAVSTIIYSSRDPLDVRHRILSSGRAQLIDEANATESERAAQALAQEGAVGMWSESDPDPEQETREGGSDQEEAHTLVAAWNWLYDTARRLWGLAFAGGFIALAVSRVIARRHNRTFKALIVGSTSAGKTALHEAWRNPDIPAEKLLRTKPTAQRDKSKHPSPVVYGRYSIYPEVTDSPGSMPGIVLEDTSSLKRRRLMIVVLAPTRANEIAQSENGAIFESEYIAEQRGYVTGLIRGVLTARTTRKPELVVVFLSKFDLYSKYPPDDSRGQAKKKTFEDAFAPHISSLKQDCSKKKIRFGVVVGSAVRRWNIDDLESLVKQTLYPRGG